MKNLLLLLVLGACAAPQPVFRPVEVDVPVSSPCRTADVAPPDFAIAHLVPDAGLGAKMQAALASLDQHEGYEEQLRAQLTLCR